MLGPLLPLFGIQALLTGASEVPVHISSLQTPTQSDCLHAWSGSPGHPPPLSEATGATLQWPECDAAIGPVRRHSIDDITRSRKLLQRNVGEASAFGEIVAVRARSMPHAIPFHSIPSHCHPTHAVSSLHIPTPQKMGTYI